MSDKTTHVFKSSKSMPVDYRLMDLDSAEKSTNSNSENGGSVGNDNIDKVDDDESRYGHIPSLQVDDKDANPSVSQQNSILPSRGWDDISVYNAKKKNYAWFQAPDGNRELARIISVTGTESLVAYSETKVLKVQSDIMLPQIQKSLMR